jgi:hypothetical protein
MRGHAFPEPFDWPLEGRFQPECLAGDLGEKFCFRAKQSRHHGGIDAGRRGDLPNAYRIVAGAGERNARGG